MSQEEKPQEEKVEEEEEKPEVDENLPKNRPELLQLMLKEEREATDKSELFFETVLTPILQYFTDHPEEGENPPEYLEMFKQYPNIIASRREYIELLEDNCTTENISGPLGPWTAHIPKLLHFFALAFHHYYLYREKFVQKCEQDDALNQLLRAKEEEFGAKVFDVLKEDTKYPKRLLPTFVLMDKYTDHAVFDPNNKFFKLTVDEVKTAALMSTVTATWQRCKAAKEDGIPDSVQSKEGTMKLTLAGKKSSYGKHVLIEQTKPDKSVHSLKGKVISKISKHSQENIEKITNEIEANMRLHHPNVLRMQLYLEDEVFHYLIFPDTEKRNLADLLGEYGKLSEEAARPIFRELVLGVQHMHSQGVIHGQISPSCVAFYKNHVRLCDFSLCTLAMRGEKKSMKMGPMHYMSPESFKEKPFDGSVNDIWSCGVILYQMLAGQHPFIEKSKKELTISIKKGNITYPKGLSSCVIFLLKGILNPDPTDRFCIEQVLSHAWMMKTREIPISYTLNPEYVPTRKRVKTPASRT